MDVILWATGFRSAIKHLAPLHLTSAEGGIALERVAGNVQVATVAAKNPRINLVGYEPLASSVGARHTGRRGRLDPCSSGCRGTLSRRSGKLNAAHR